MPKWKISYEGLVVFPGILNKADPDPDLQKKWSLDL